MGLPAEIETVVKDLWSLRLRTLQHRLVNASDEEAVFSSQVTSDVEMEASRHVKGDGRPLRTRNLPRLIDSLGLCYLAMMLLRLPVSLGDLHR